MSERHHRPQQSSSFLVRCWVEPRDAVDRPEVLRLYVRNLRTGEEHYLGDPSEVGPLLQRDLDERMKSAASARRLRESEAG